MPKASNKYVVSYEDPENLKTYLIHNVGCDNNNNNNNYYIFIIRTHIQW